MLVSITEFSENWRSKRCAFLMAIKEIKGMHVP
jgi:hypothetical protein